MLLLFVIIIIHSHIVDLRCDFTQHKWEFFRRWLFHASFFNSIDSGSAHINTRINYKELQIWCTIENIILTDVRSRKKMKTWSTWWDTTEIIWRKIASYRSCRRWLAKRKIPHRGIIWRFPRSSKLWGWCFQNFCRLSELYSVFPVSTATYNKCSFYHLRCVKPYLRSMVWKSE